MTTRWRWKLYRGRYSIGAKQLLKKVAGRYNYSYIGKEGSWRGRYKGINRSYIKDEKVSRTVDEDGRNENSSGTR